MFNEFLLYLPSSVSLILMLILGICGKQTKSYKQLLPLFLVLTVFFYTDACFAYKNIDYYTLTYTTLISQLVTPCIIPLSWLYLTNLKGKRPGYSISAFWIIAPVFLFSCAAMLHVLNGTDNEVMFMQIEDKSIISAKETDRMYILSSFFKNKAFRVVLLLEVMMMIYYIIRNIIITKLNFKKYRRFLFGGGSISPFHAQLINFLVVAIFATVKILLQRSWLIQHQGAAVILALISTAILMITGIIAMFSSWDELCLSDMTFNMPRSYEDEAAEVLEVAKGKGKSVSSEETPEATDTAAQPAAEPASAPVQEEIPEPKKEETIDGIVVRTPVIPTLQPGPETTVNTVLLGKFEDLIINRQMFLTPGLTINDIAQKLGTNRTYISQLVNDNYHMPFPDLLNNLRIDYAEQYILHNREAKQNEVAQACGFPSASSFNVTFKKITGVTPRIWLATYADNN